MHFKTLYDLSNEKVNFLIAPLPHAYFFLIIGISLLITYVSSRKKRGKRKILLIGLGCTFISSILLSVFLVGQFLDIRKAKKIFDTKEFFVVEGMLLNYFPMPKEGHTMEKFDIDGVHFEYSDFHLGAAGYHNAASLGGVIVPFYYYRLTYYKSNRGADSNRIIKIEIRE